MICSNAKFSRCHFRSRCIGFARRRVGRGGRIILDRASTNYDDVWSRLDYTIFDSAAKGENHRVEITSSACKNDIISQSLELRDILPSSSVSTLPNVLNNQKAGFVITRENSISETFANSESIRVSESSTTNDPKLDDFEMLLDSASANSNIINKKLVRGESNAEECSDNKSRTKSLSEVQVHDETSNHPSETNCIEKSSSADFNADAGGEIDFGFTFADSANDIYSEFMDEIRNEWLHFRPQTPPESPIDVIFDSDLADSSKKYSIELQLLEAHKSDELKSFTDNVFTTQPVSFNISNNSLLISDAPNTRENFIQIKKEPLDNDQPIEEVVNVDEIDVIKKFIDCCKDDISREENDNLIDLNDFICEENEYPRFDARTGCSSFKVSDDVRKYKSSVPDANKNLSNEEHNDIKTETIDVGASKSNVVPIAELQTHNYVLKYGSPNNITPVSLHSINTNYNLTNSNAIETSLSLTSSKAQQQYITSSNTIISSPHLQNKMQPIVYDSNTIVLATQPRRQLNGPTDRTCKSNMFTDHVNHFH